MEITFNQLPEAVAKLINMVEALENRLARSLSPILVQDQPLNVDEAAKFLGISKHSLYGLTSAREILFYKKGKRVYFLKEDLVVWLKSGRQSTISEIKGDAVKSLKIKPAKF